MNDTSFSERRTALSDEDIARRARELFTSACANIDAHDQLRLQRASRVALRGGTRPAPHAAWLVATAGVVACSLLVVAFVRIRGVSRHQAIDVAASSAPPAVIAATALNDVGWVTATQEPVVMVQNLGFYRWLAAQPAQSSGPSHAVVHE
ncbi:MAG TPA: hypothetical protein VF292_10030 [Rhodanobacteraceae bacterium]